MRKNDELRRSLSNPFPVDCVKWKPEVTKNMPPGKCRAVAYIDARAVQKRLDDVIGPENWQDEYEVLNQGSVICRLSIWIADRWIVKSDVGSLSEQSDDGDKLKAAFSDALKRAAVKWGIGRYLYYLPFATADFDNDRKRITQPPKLPDWALPKPAGK